ncbi:type II toxin-antitoxin system Phd/YefM family antitoxin [Streptomyces cyaneofuscatus]|uniref:type II toxin-antitoxin system Phd/YefM family antitoxin n=1 Tax=Streptomyces TaxID=1883 RepID=UPI002E11965B|nr:type II toxin-antitoxin system Phd/YefM family antitoxin [Streptomyces cyaneofuscatus]WTF36143.1 type II toxin-antitoxin system Phd/YefM family antitoxin [Streptomyces cyaneofuscatus]
MTEPAIEPVTEVRKHLSEIIDRACRHETPTIITRRGGSEAVLPGIEEYHRLCETAERSEDERLNRLADQAESEGTEGSVPMDQMAALLRSANPLVRSIVTHRQKEPPT